MATNPQALPVRLQLELKSNPDMPDSMILLTEQEVAKILGVPGATMRTWRYRRKYDIRTVAMGSGVRYTWEETLRLMREGVK